MATQKPLTPRQLHKRDYKPYIWAGFSETVWKYIGWLGMVTTIAGSYGMSWGHYFAGFALLFVGSLAWFAIGCVKRDHAMWTMQSVLFVSEIVGIYRNF